MFFSFRVQKGTLVAISREVIRTYAILKEKYPNAKEGELSSLIWDRWLPINRERLWTDDSEIRFLRFEEICDRRQAVGENENAFNAFFDILYIETGISPLETKRFKKAAIHFTKDAEILGFNFKEQLKIELKNAKQLRKDKKMEQKYPNLPQKDPNLPPKSRGSKKPKH